MSVRVERRFDIDASVEDVWRVISEPTVRARAISVVDSYRQSGDTIIWEIKLPIPFIRKTIDVKTRNVEVDPPRYVRFQGKSSAFSVQGEHTIIDANGKVTVDNAFVVEGRAPGVETFFRKNLDKELDNLEEALKTDLRSN